MRFALTDEQEMLRESVRGALARELALPRLREALERGDAGARMRALAAAQGWTGIGVPEEAGGQGGGVVEQAILAEELGHAAAPTSLLFAGAVAARLLAAGGGAAADLLTGLADGERAVVPALDAGTAAAGDVTVSGGRVSGEVAHVLGAPEADVLLVLAAGDASAVEIGAGAAVRARALVDPGRSIGDVVLDGAVAEDLGAAGDLGSAAALGAVLVAAEAVGAASRLLALTVEYVAQREQFGVVIGSFQAIKHTAADMLVEVETARSLVYHAAWALDADDPAAETAVGMAKAYASSASASVADKALALHGAVGFTWEHDLHLFLKRTHTAGSLFGSARTHRERIAAALDLTGERTAALVG